MAERDMHPAEKIEAIINRRNGDHRPWTDAELAAVERASLEERFESAPRAMVFRPPFERLDIVVRNVDELVRAGIHVSETYIRSYWGNEAARRYSELRAQNRVSGK
jgi:hypothetical protein